MSEFHSPNKSESPSLALSDLFFLLCSFLLSHPLYLSYLVFFSPYLFKLLSFLSPLFATTALLLLAFLTLVHGAGGQARSDDNNDDILSSDNLLKCYSSAPFAVLRFILRVGGAINDRRQEDSEEEAAARTIYEELEVYKIVFQVTEIPGGLREASPEVVEKPKSDEEIRSRISVEIFSESEILQKPAEETIPEKEIWCETVTEYSSGWKSASAAEEEVVEEVSAADDVHKLKEEMGEGGGESEKKTKQQPLRNSGSDQMSQSTIAAEEDLFHLNQKEENPASHRDCCLGNFGSMRKEKEWKRTLACKLFEERHSGGGGGGEAMDSLWERYEAESDKLPQAESSRPKTKTKKKKKKALAYEEEEEEEEEDEDGGGGAHLCCLQALKLSAGKMNMGMGRPGLVRISKALKGIGWLHHVGGRSVRKGSSY